MPEAKYDLPETMIRHRGFFHYGELQQAIRQYFVEENYNLVNYPMYKQKFATPMGVEQEFKIKAEKKITEYVRFHMEVFFRVYDLRDIEIIRDGKKVTLQEGKIIIALTPTIEFDWQKRFHGSKFLKALDDFYRSYIIKYKIADYWEDMLLIKTEQLAKIMKTKLGQEVM